MQTYGSGSDIYGDKLHQRLAREALPILVNVALAGNTITYGRLAEELTHRHLQDNPIHHRIIGKVGGCISDALIALSGQWEETIPPISAIIINKGSEQPGPGVDFFLEQYFGKSAVESEHREEFVDLARKMVCEYEHWGEVLEELGLDSVILDENGELSEQSSKGFGGGEGEDHKALKQFVSKNPQLVTNYSILSTETEHALPSGDWVDVFFESRRCVYAVEVKGIRSSESDLLRGIYQCLKYKAVLEARELLQGSDRRVEAILIISGDLSPQLVSIKNALGVKVISHILPK